ncbi:DUF4126 domain-containing protein [Marinobacterium aestuariivivens]|uniref:DUF4126 domain-containing protein n=1 Tax=Marinobacterium aestuariivivens TaxID=1698799 RepID=A0ABW1ZX49_9GAMM
MEQLDQITQMIALSMGLAWASGINLYATLLMLGVLSNMGHIVLPPGLEVVGDPLVIMAAGFMYCVEFFADKVPGVDTGWDTLHTFVRIPAGAALAAGAVGDISPVVGLAAAIVGGGLSAGTHALKAGSRVMINTSPEPFSNWTASVTEDVAVVAGLWAALFNPWLFLGGLVIFVLLLVWLLPKVWRGVKRVFRFLARLFGGNGSEPPPLPRARRYRTIRSTGTDGLRVTGCKSRCASSVFAPAIPTFPPSMAVTAFSSTLRNPAPCRRRRRVLVTTMDGGNTINAGAVYSEAKRTAP